MSDPYRVSSEIVKRNSGVMIVDLPGQFDHRGMVLRAACDLENQMVLLLLAFMRSLNPNLAEARVRKDLFSENGLIGSLSKMNRLASHFALINDDVSHDLRIVVKLRNQYAHGLHRDQFYRDPDSAATVRQLRLFINSQALFDGIDEQGIFLACYEQLKVVLTTRMRALGEK